MPYCQDSIFKTPSNEAVIPLKSSYMAISICLILGWIIYNNQEYQTYLIAMKQSWSDFLAQSQVLEKLKVSYTQLIIYTKISQSLTYMMYTFTRFQIGKFFCGSINCNGCTIKFCFGNDHWIIGIFPIRTWIEITQYLA